MRVAIFRGEGVLQGPELGRVPFFRFCPIESDEGRGLVGSGAEPWKIVTVPFGSRIVADRRSGQPVLYLPGAARALVASELAGKDGTWANIVAYPSIGPVHPSF